VEPVARRDLRCFGPLPSDLATSAAEDIQSSGVPEAKPAAPEDRAHPMSDGMLLLAEVVISVRYWGVPPQAMIDVGS